METQYAPEEISNKRQYKVYDVIYASADVEAAITQFLPLKEDVPSDYILCTAGSDGKWRIGQIYMVTECLETAIASLDADRLLA